MKKIYFIALFLIFCSIPALAVNFGSYRTETEYGLIDGFKWNFFNREKGEPVVQLRSETKEEQIRIEKNKDKPKEVQDDVQLYRFMTQDIVAF